MCHCHFIMASNGYFVLFFAKNNNEGGFKVKSKIINYFPVKNHVKKG